MATTVKKHKHAETQDLSARDSTHSPRMGYAMHTKPEPSVTVNGTIILRVYVTYVNFAYTRYTQLFFVYTLYIMLLRVYVTHNEPAYNNSACIRYIQRFCVYTLHTINLRVYVTYIDFARIRYKR